MARCAIALGSNLGDSLQILQQALQALHRPPGLTLLAQSQIYQTIPVGPPQPDYLNACALVTTDLPPETLMNTLLGIEASFGRVRRERWGPRHLDLDLLLYDQLILTSPTLRVPHPRMSQRAFVLVPLAEIAPDWIDPISGKTIQNLCAGVNPEGVTPLHLKPAKDR